MVPLKSSVYDRLQEWVEYEYLEIAGARLFCQCLERRYDFDDCHPAAKERGDILLASRRIGSQVIYERSYQSIRFPQRML